MRNEPSGVAFPHSKDRIAGANSRTRSEHGVPTRRKTIIGPRGPDSDAPEGGYFIKLLYPRNF